MVVRKEEKTMLKRGLGGLLCSLYCPQSQILRSVGGDVGRIFTDMSSSPLPFHRTIILTTVGLYDTWVARDVCGTPLRLVWPYVKDPVSKQLLSENRPFEVASCWNGIVAFPAQPYLFNPDVNRTEPASPSRHAKRGWKMVDDGKSLRHLSHHANM